MNYEWIKSMASEMGVRVKDLCALAPNNDPFYTGRPSDIESGEWFRDLYDKHFGHRVYLRRMHYTIVSISNVPKPNGEMYENTDADWSLLQTAAKNARYMGLVEMDQFFDNRNPDPYTFTNFTNPGDDDYIDPEPRAEVSPAYEDWLSDYYNAPEIPSWPQLHSLPEPGYYTASGYTSVQQDYHIEIWCEKSAMNDVIIPLCQQYGANLVTGLGEMSITAVNELMNRVEKSQRPARILYISDYDPAGFGMPVSVSVKIQYFVSSRHPDMDIKLYPICMTREQIEQYHLPRVPSKKSDKRKVFWDYIHGQGVVELDALEALRPGELERILRQNIKAWYDDSLPERANVALDTLDQELNYLRDQIIDTYEDRLDDYGEAHDELVELWAELEREYDLSISSLADKARQVSRQVNDLVSKHKELCAEIEADMALSIKGKEDLYFPDVPEPQLDVEPEALFQSDRGYMEQLRIFKHHRNRTEQGVLI